MKKLAAVLTFTLTTSVHAQITLTLQQTVNLDSTAVAGNPEFIGSNPSAVAWNGTDLFVAGYNNNPPGTTIQCAIVPIGGALSGTPSFGAPFGSIATPGFRGYSGLDVSSGRLAASYDNGAASPDGIRAFDLIGNPLWSRNARGGSGVGFDPGFPGGNPALGSGVGWTTFGSARRALQDATLGTDIWTSANGMLMDSGISTFWRDMDFDDASGDIWLRRSNLLVYVPRGGDNMAVVSGIAFPFDPMPADFIGLQYVAFVNAPGGSFVIFNDRATAAGTQSMQTVVKVVRRDGTPDSIGWGTFAPLPGNGAYDFSYDAASNTLAILDFTNRDVHIFSVDAPPYYSYGAGCINSSGNPATLTFSGLGVPGQQLTMTIAGGPSTTAAAILFGIGRPGLPLGNGCTLDVNPIPGWLVNSIGLDASGSGSFSLTVPTLASGFTFNAQAAIIDGGLVGLPVATSNGVTYLLN